MRCDDVAVLLPETVDVTADSGLHTGGVDLPLRRHIEGCLHCQAELARYRRMLRGLQLLRTHYLEPNPGLLAQTLASVAAAGERHAIRSILTGKRLAYAGAITGAVAAATAGAIVVQVRRSRRRTAVAAN